MENPYAQIYAVVSRKTKNILKELAKTAGKSERQYLSDLIEETAENAKIKFRKEKG